MEGHSAPIQTDGNYVNDKYLKNAVKEEYLRCVPDFSFENVEVKFLTSEEKRTLEEQVSRMEEKYEELKQDMEEKEKRNERIADYVRYVMKKEFKWDKNEIDKIF